LKLLPPNVTPLTKGKISANSQAILCKNYIPKTQKIGQLSYINYLLHGIQQAFHQRSRKKDQAKGIRKDKH